MCGGITERWDWSIVVPMRSLIPKMAPTAKAPTATLRTASSVRLLLCQRSNQIFCQMTPISGLCRAVIQILVLVLVGCLVQHFARLLGLAQQRAQVLVGHREDLDRAARAGPDRGAVLMLMEELHLAEVFARPQLERD